MLLLNNLFFKKYLTKDTKITPNNYYHHQLLINLKCPEITFSEIQNVDYKENELVKFFIRFNKCGNSEFINFNTKQKKDLFNLTIRPGLQSSSLSITNSLSSTRNTNFGNKLGLRIGIEAEIIFPFNNNKWALIVEPTYQSFKSTKETTDLISTIDYSSVEIPVGIRHYMFINNKSKLFLNSSFIVDFSSNSKIDFEKQYNPSLEIKPSRNYAFGFGYNYNEKYSLELRYYTSRDLLKNYNLWSSEYNSLSVIFGYSIL